MVEARDFHCYSYVFENSGKRSIPYDHADERVVIPKPTSRGYQGNRIPSWMSKHPVEKTEMRNDPRTVLHGQGRETRLSGKWLLVCETFDRIFRWFQDTIIPRNLAGLDFLQPVQCAYVDDLAVAALSFRDLMTPLALAFHSVDQKVGSI